MWERQSLRVFKLEYSSLPSTLGKTLQRFLWGQDNRVRTKQRADDMILQTNTNILWQDPTPTPLKPFKRSPEPVMQKSSSFPPDTVFWDSNLEIIDNPYGRVRDRGDKVVVADFTAGSQAQ